MTAPSPVRVALIGATGHGKSHRRTIADLQATGRVELVALCDIQPIPGVPAGVEVFTDHRDLLTVSKPDVVVICTPPHTHTPIAVAAASAGADVLLEKPPVLDLDEHRRLAEVVAETGAALQIGFQALASVALDQLMSTVDSGGLGELTTITMRGAWFRDESYFRRSAWVGRASVEGRPALDGALVNPFAHAVMQVLAIADRPVESVEVQRFRTRDIEVDDTACVRLHFAGGLRALIAVTLCAQEYVPGEIVVTGTAGRAELEYTTDRLRLPGWPEMIEVPGRRDLLANLLDHRADPAVPLIAPLERTRPFTALLRPITAAPPALIGPEHLSTRHDLASPRLVIDGINDVVARAALDCALFSELDVPWARPVNAARQPIDLGSTS